MLELRQADGAGQLEMPQPLGDPRQVIGMRLVRREQQAGGGNLHQQIGEGRKNDGFIRGPRGARDDRKRVARLPRVGEASERLA